MGSRTALAVAVGMVALACKTLTTIPPTDTSWKRMEEIPQRAEDIVLVLPRAAIPAVEVEVDGVRRRFLIGDALQTILREYCDHAFGRVVTSESRPTDTDADFVVEPELARFDVSTSWAGKYRFEVGLRARVSSPGGREPFLDFHGLGKEETFGNEATLAIATNSTLQAAVADLVGKLVRELPARAPKEPGG